MATFDDFLKLDIRVGEIVSAEEFPKARKPAYKIKIDFGPLGEKSSSAQLTELYDCADLIGRQVIAVCNFPPLQVADYISEVLVLGIYGSEGVVLLQPERPVRPGDRIG